MQILQSSAFPQVQVLLPTTVRQFYLRGDGGSLVAKNLGNDITGALMDGTYAQHTVAHKAEIVIVSPARDNYIPQRYLTLGDFYTNELFYELFFIPLRAWVYDPQLKNYVEKTQGSKLNPNILSTFLMRGRSMDELLDLTAPFEDEAFVAWQELPFESRQKWKGGWRDFVAQFLSAKMNASIYTFTIVKGEGVKSYYYLEWQYREPETEYEKGIVEIAQKVSSDKQLSRYCFNVSVERAEAKSLLASGASTAAEENLVTTAPVAVANGKKSK